MKQHNNDSAPPQPNAFRRQRELYQSYARFTNAKEAAIEFGKKIKGSVSEAEVYEMLINTTNPLCVERDLESKEVFVCGTSRIADEQEAMGVSGWLDELDSIVNDRVVHFKRIAGRRYSVNIERMSDCGRGRVESVVEQKCRRLHCSLPYATGKSERWATKSDMSHFMEELEDDTLDPRHCDVVTSMQGSFLYLFKKQPGGYVGTRKQLSEDQIRAAETALLDSQKGLWQRGSLPSFTYGLNCYLGHFYSSEKRVSDEIIDSALDFYRKVISDSIEAKQKARAVTGIALCHALREDWKLLGEKSENALRYLRELTHEEKHLSGLHTEYVQALRQHSFAQAHFGDFAIARSNLSKAISLCRKHDKNVLRSTHVSTLIHSAVVEWSANPEGGEGGRVFDSIKRTEDWQTYLRQCMPYERQWYESCRQKFDEGRDVPPPLSASNTNTSLRIKSQKTVANPTESVVLSVQPEEGPEGMPVAKPRDLVSVFGHISRDPKEIARQFSTLDIEIMQEVLEEARRWRGEAELFEVEVGERLTPRIVNRFLKKHANQRFSDIDNRTIVAILKRFEKEGYDIIFDDGATQHLVTVTIDKQRGRLNFCSKGTSYAMHKKVTLPAGLSIQQPDC